MAKNRSKQPPKTDLLPNILPPLLFPSKNNTERKWMLELKKKGLIRPIGPRLYTSIPDAKLKEVVRGSWAQILSQLFPKALLSHRSAIEYRPSPQNEIFLTSTTHREVHYPGLTLQFERGPGALSTDVDFLQLKASSLPRALLENLSTTRGKDSSKNLSADQIEKKLEEIFTKKGEVGLNQVRDQARAISLQLGWSLEFKRLNSLISALLGTRSVEHLSTESARARAAGNAFDSACLEKLQILFSELRHRSFLDLKDSFRAKEHFRHKAFFEAYFSNYIEGTTFEIEEAEAIVFSGQIPAQRPKDAHDVLGTYEIVSDRSSARIVPEDFGKFKKLLKSRHQTLMGARPETQPGVFKEKPNRAGNTEFVTPELVEGTLRKGFELYRNLPLGLARSIFVMFLVAEVHPFMDGNGRIARIMMNSELLGTGLSTIIIPTVYREDYISGLRALSRRNRALPLIQILERAQRFSHLEFSPYPKVLKYLELHHWFEEPDEAKILEDSGVF